jgi:hypothetical protein
MLARETLFTGRIDQRLRWMAASPSSLSTASTAFDAAPFSIPDAMFGPAAKLASSAAEYARACVCVGKGSCDHIPPVAAVPLLWRRVARARSLRLIMFYVCVASVQRRLCEDGGRKSAAKTVGRSLGHGGPGAGASGRAAVLPVS